MQAPRYGAAPPPNPYTAPVGYPQGVAGSYYRAPPPPPPPPPGPYGHPASYAQPAPYAQPSYHPHPHHAQHPAAGQRYHVPGGAPLPSAPFGYGIPRGPAPPPAQAGYYGTPAYPASRPPPPGTVVPQAPTAAPVKAVAAAPAAGAAPPTKVVAKAENLNPNADAWQPGAGGISPSADVPAVPSAAQTASTAPTATGASSAGASKPLPPAPTASAATAALEHSSLECPVCHEKGLLTEYVLRSHMRAKHPDVQYNPATQGAPLRPEAAPSVHASGEGIHTTALPAVSTAVALTETQRRVIQLIIARLQDAGTPSLNGSQDVPESSTGDAPSGTPVFSARSSFLPLESVEEYLQTNHATLYAEAMLESSSLADLVETAAHSGGIPLRANAQLDGTVLLSVPTDP